MSAFRADSDQPLLPNSDLSVHSLAVMPDSVARLVFRAVVVVLGKVRAAHLLQMVVFGEIGSDQEDGCEGEPGKQNQVGSSETPSLDWTRLESAKVRAPDKATSRRCQGILFLILLLSERREPRR